MNSLKQSLIVESHNLDTMAPHGDESSNPIHNSPAKVDLTFDPNERKGLTTEEAEAKYLEWGYNELPEVTISVWYVLFLQFIGTMPYMLELAAIIAIAVQDYVDFAIIASMLLCNGFLGFHEQMKAAESLVRNLFFILIFAYR